jgi:hypothetical protein
MSSNQSAGLCNESFLSNDLQLLDFDEISSSGGLVACHLLAVPAETVIAWNLALFFWQPISIINEQSEYRIDSKKGAGLSRLRLGEAILSSISSRVFLDKNGILYHADGTRKLADNGRLPCCTSMEKVAVVVSTSSSPSA